MNHQSSKQTHVARAKRGKTRAGKSRLVLVLLLIGQESGARFFSQSQTVAVQNQSNCVITFDAQLKTALSHFLIKGPYEPTCKYETFGPSPVLDVMLHRPITPCIQLLTLPPPPPRPQRNPHG